MTRFARYGAVLLLVGLAPSTRADATLRFHTDIQTSSLIPGATLDQALGGKQDIVVQIKGNKARSSMSNLISIMDLKTQDLTLVDTVHKRFSTVPAAQYAEQVKLTMPAVPDGARAMLSSIKTNVESHNTGRTAVIQGIQSEEREFVLSMDMAIPGAPATGAPLMKMIMQIWNAKPDEAQRVPALQVVKNYTASASFAVNPAEMVKQFTAAIPGLGDGLGAMIGQMSKDGAVALRTHTEIVMPLLAAMSQQVSQQGGQGLPAGLDSNAPLMQMNQELIELSTDLIDDGLFQIPADYQRASLDEILKGAATLPEPPQFKQ